MRIKEALETLAANHVEVEIRYDNSIILSGEYSDITEMIAQPRSGGIMFKSYDGCDKLLGHYTFWQAASKTREDWVINDIPVRMIAAMRLVAQEIADY